MFVYSAIGIFAFFVPITYKGVNSIPLDHIVTLIKEHAGPVVPYIILALALAGTVRSIAVRPWRINVTAVLFAIANTVGLIVSALWVFGLLPSWLAADDLVPFLWNKIAIPVGLIVPIGGLFLSLLLGYGLLEFVGVFMQPVMRPLWRTPGRSAIDAVASFVGSYSLGLLITDRVYRDGGYTAREAAIIGAGFSTVSAAFMVIVAKALGLMDHWLLYFFVSLVVTFAVSALMVRLPPITLIPDEYYPGSTPDPEKPVTGNRFAAAWAESKKVLDQAPSLGRNLWTNLLDGLKMSASIVPSIMSIGLAGLVLAKFTPVFTWLGYLFVPFAWLVRLPDPVLAGKAFAVSIAEMFLPSTVVADHPSLELRFVVGVVSVSAIIFFSAMVPALLSTEIPLKIWHMVLIWFVRVVLTVVIAAPIAHVLL
ncbi:YjiH family protein [Corynebacterium tapiri]|uniref:YjiH family protein n=2 Tax=Corynebacterium tapiri TaxID=1448266 RepID=A0A5C4U2W7_9CORY|nr:YjiH family protein [Corynebacterium tapiri]